MPSGKKTMRDREPSISFDELPDLEIKADQREGMAAKPQARKPAAKPAGQSVVLSNNHHTLIYGALALIIAMLAFIGFEFYVQSEKLNARVVELENKLSTTDASVNQSGAALQLAIQDLKEKQGVQQSQIERLWSANKKVDLAVNTQAKQVNALDGKMKSQAGQIDQLSKADEAIGADVKVLNARSETISSIDARVKSNTQDIAGMKAKVAAVESSSTVVKKKVDQNSGWIESNNAFRQQTNQSLNRLEQQIKNLQGAGAQ